MTPTLECLKTEEIWALDTEGNKIHGHATLVTSSRIGDAPIHSWEKSMVRVHREEWSVVVSFVEHGDVEVQLYALDEESLDRVIAARHKASARERAARERARIRESHKVRIEDLVGQEIQQVYLDERSLVFCLAGGHRWRFIQRNDLDYIETSRPWVLAGATVKSVDVSADTVTIYTDKVPYLTVPFHIIFDAFYPEDELSFHPAQEATRDELESMTLIAGKRP